MRTAPLRRVLVLAIAALAAGGCGIDGDDHARFEPHDAVPFDLLGTAPPGTNVAAPGAGAEQTTVCLTGADGRIHPVGRAVPAGYELADLADLLLAGPTDAERSFGLATSIGDPGAVRTITLQGGVAIVDLDPAVATLPTTDQLDAIAQLVCTLTAQPGIGQVRFRVDGEAIGVPRGDGSTTTEPVAREDYERLIAPAG